MVIQEIFGVSDHVRERCATFAACTSAMTWGHGDDATASLPLKIAVILPVSSMTKVVRFAHKAPFTP